MVTLPPDQSNDAAAPATRAPVRYRRQRNHIVPRFVSTETYANDKNNDITVATVAVKHDSSQQDLASWSRWLLSLRYQAEWRGAAVVLTDRALPYGNLCRPVTLRGELSLRPLDARTHVLPLTAPQSFTDVVMLTDEDVIFTRPLDSLFAMARTL